MELSSGRHAITGVLARCVMLQNLHNTHSTTSVVNHRSVAQSNEENKERVLELTERIMEIL